MKMFGFGGAKGVAEVPGAASGVRLKQGEPVQFIVRADSQTADPQSFVQFMTVKQLKDRRQVVMVNAGWYGAKQGDGSNRPVQFDAAKYGAASFRIVPAGALAPGEYVLSTATSQTGFFFGVDP